MVRALSLLLASVAFCATAEAANLVVVDDAQYGVGAGIKDNVTGLTWLKPVKTKRISYDTISSVIASSGNYNGFRFATASELLSLAYNFSAPLGDFLTVQKNLGNLSFELVSSNPTVVSAGLQFIDLFQPTVTNNTFNSSGAVIPSKAVRGWILQDNTTARGDYFNLSWVDARQINPSFSLPAGVSSGFTSSVNTSAAYNDGGSWLVRIGPAAPAVPEPATWATMLLGFGVTGMAARRRRRVAVA